jgi:hypothetical protein
VDDTNEGEEPVERDIHHLKMSELVKKDGAKLGIRTRLHQRTGQKQAGPEPAEERRSGDHLGNNQTDGGGDPRVRLAIFQEIKQAR